MKIRCLIQPGLILFPVVAVLMLAVSAVAQDENQNTETGQPDAAAVAEDNRIIEELARFDKLVAAGKTTKAIAEVRKLWEKTGHLRAGYALSQLLQKYGAEQSQRSRSKGHKYFVEGGELARKLLADSEFPDQFRDEIVGAVYNEACSHAVNKAEDEAIQSLRDAIELGFEDFSQIEDDTSFAGLARNDAFTALIAESRAKIRERIVAGIRKEIADFESFAFDFDQADLAGRPLSLTALRGKIVIVDFWGTWCPPCRAEIPAFIKLKENYGEHLEVVGLAYEKGEVAEAPQKVIDFGLKNNINYPCAIGMSETKSMVPEFRGYPTTLFIDGTGKVRMMTVGAESYEKLEAIVLALMEGEG